MAGLPAHVARNGGWIRVTGRRSNLDANNGAPGFDIQEGGFLTGYDRRLDNGMVAGIAAGYNHAGVDEETGASGTINTARVALYGNAMWKGVVLDAAVGYARDFIDATRPISGTSETATSSHQANEATGAFQAGLPLDADGYTLVPKAGVNYVHLSEPSFNETGAPGYNLSVQSHNSDSLRPYLGASVSRSFTTSDGMILTPEANASVSHELIDKVPSSTFEIGGGTFGVNGVQPARNDVNVGGGLNATLTNRLALFADYQATLPTGNLFSQSLSGGLIYRF